MSLYHSRVQQYNDGVPALVFILPSMIILLTVVGAIVSDQWDNLWNYNASKIDS